MTVIELVSYLERMPPDSPVIMEVRSGEVRAEFYKILKIRESGNFIPTVYLCTESPQ